MTASLTDYKGLEVVSPDPTGGGGLAINNDFKALADWHPKSVWDQSADPGVDNDIDESFYVGSLWYRSDTGVLFICTDNTTGAAVWKLLLVQPDTNQPLQADTEGDARGNNATDMQRDRTADTQVASGANAVIAGGSANQASAEHVTISGGRNNLPNFIYTTLVGGRNNRANADYSTVMGRNARTTLQGQVSQAMGDFATTGDAQASVLVARNETSDATATELFLDGASERLILASDQTWAFSGLLVARRTDANNESAGWKFDGVIDNFGGAVALVGTPAITSIGDDSGGTWLFSISADDTNDALKLTVTGEVSKTIRWVAKIDLAEVMS